MEPPAEFEFPFTPYDTQRDFMKHLYEIIESGKLGILESPTGTGKSMSLICGALRWLCDHEQRELREAERQVERVRTSFSSSVFSRPRGAGQCVSARAGGGSGSSLDSWVLEQAADRARQIELAAAVKRLERIRRSRARVVVRSHKREPLDRSAKQVEADDIDKAEEAEDDSELVQAAASDREEVPSDSDSDDDNEEDAYHHTQIIFASRTHSQLSQFASEVRRSPLGGGGAAAAPVCCVTLGSRLQLCTHAPVRRLAHLSLVNQACLDLQRNNNTNSSSSEGKCGVQLAQTDARGRGCDGNGSGDRHTPAHKRRKTTTAEAAATGAGCPYKQNIDELADQYLSEVCDVEQLVARAGKLRSCAYYGSRRAARHARLLLLPYTVLLHPATRRAAGVRLTASTVVLIDEAHNLLETVYAVHASRLGRAHVATSVDQLTHYQRQYRRRFSPRTVLLLRQLASALAGLLRVFATVTATNTNTSSATSSATSGATNKGTSSISSSSATNTSSSNNRNSLTSSISSSGDDSVRVMSVNEFLEQCGVDNINLLTPVRFAETSRLALKLRSCWNRRQRSQPTPEPATGTRGLASFLDELCHRAPPAAAPAAAAGDVKATAVSAAASSQTTPATEAGEEDPELHLLPCLQFLATLAEAEPNSRLLVSVSRRDQRQSYVKFLPLDVATRFNDIACRVRSVVLAGGTMQPFGEFVDQLFVAGGQSRDRVSVFSCGHVISGRQLLPLSLARGPSGVELLFTFQRRHDSALLDEVGRILVNYCRIIPGGIVCFLSSYDMMDTVFGHLTRSRVIDKISTKKKVFCEPRNAGETDRVLHQYSRAVKLGHSITSTSTSTTNNNNSAGGGGGQTGALLFSVVGGKMSEGINFNDELGRCVIVVGLPYPNVNSPELKEKMALLNKTCPAVVDGRTAGQQLYENLCMKGVNQSIGRAIRHRSDYACMVLCDVRYSRANVVRALPQWVSQRLTHCDNFGASYGQIKKFFTEMAGIFPVAGAS